MFGRTSCLVHMFSWLRNCPKMNPRISIYIQVMHRMSSMIDDCCKCAQLNNATSILWNEIMEHCHYSSNDNFQDHDKRPYFLTCFT